MAQLMKTHHVKVGCCPADGRQIVGQLPVVAGQQGFEAFRSYYEYLPKGTVKMQYTLRLNNVGDFALPPSRVEALYAPEMFGAAPNARVQVLAAPLPAASSPSK